MAEPVLFYHFLDSSSLIRVQTIEGRKGETLLETEDGLVVGTDVKTNKTQLYMKEELISRR